MKRKPLALALVDLLVTVAAAVLLVSVAVPSLSRVRELSKRTLCGVNLSGIGAAANVYAASNSGNWMVPPFKRSLINNSSGGVAYLPTSATAGTFVGYERQYQTRSDTSNQANVEGTALSVTRAYWMLVRSGDVSVKQFVCPSSSSDLPDPTENIDLYYDFTSYSNISYGYQVPFGPPDTRAREGMDNRQIIAADKGPFYLPSYYVEWWQAGSGRPGLQLDGSPKDWRVANSFNHGGLANGEGESVLFPDGHASFVRIPAVGIDNDNIYTLMLNGWGALPYNRTWGDTPHQAPTGGPPYPGQDAFGVGPGAYAATDSLIYP